MEPLRTIAAETRCSCFAVVSVRMAGWRRPPKSFSGSCRLAPRAAGFLGNRITHDEQVNHGRDERNPRSGQQRRYEGMRGLGDGTGNVSSGGASAVPSGEAALNTPVGTPRSRTRNQLLTNAG